MMEILKPVSTPLSEPESGNCQLKINDLDKTEFAMTFNGAADGAEIQVVYYQ